MQTVLMNVQITSRMPMANCASCEELKPRPPIYTRQHIQIYHDLLDGRTRTTTSVDSIPASPLM